MAEPFIGEICIFGFNFAPIDWALCNGQVMQINQNAALYSLLGTTYGGNGTVTFGIPDLQGRMPIGMGAGAGLTSRPIGTKAGQENATLNANQLPAHTHSVSVNGTASVRAATDNGNTATPVNGAYLATGKSGLSSLNNYFTGTPANTVTLGGAGQVTSTGTTGATGAGQPVSLMNPFLALNFCIALVGLYPSRP
jgi:microcystin-dependent protein